MPAGRAVIGADAHQPVDAGFRLGIAIGVLAPDLQRGRLDPGLLARRRFDQLDLVTALFGPALIHAQQHLRPVLGFSPTCARMNLDIGVVRVRFAGEQCGHLVAFRAGDKRVERGGQLVGHGGVAVGIGQFDQLDRIGQFAFDRGDRSHRRVEPLALLHDRLGGLWVVPQRGVLDARVQLRQPAGGAVPVEETADERHRGGDLVVGGLRFGAHGETPVTVEDRPRGKTRRT